MTGDTTRRTVLTGMGAAAILGGTGMVTAGGDDSESDDENGNGNGDGGNVASLKGFHASPDAPNVDVYVNDVLVLEDVAFGEVSDYLVLLSGEYDVMVVPTGEDTDAAVIDQSVEVPAGAATAVVVGEAAEDGDQPLELLLLEVELGDLGEDESRVRAVHASPDAPAVDIVAGDQVLVSDLEFGNAESVDVPADSYTLEIRPAGGEDAVAEFDVELAPNTIYSAYAVGYLEPEDDQPAFDLLLDVDALTPDTEGDDDEQAADDGEEEDDETASVSFEDQESDGTSVEVASATLPEGGFVTIHDSTLLEGEVTGSVIGVSEYLDSGDQEDIVVDLYEGVPGAEFDDDELTEDETLIAMPHLDTNDNEEYDFVESEGEDDGPYTEDGEPVIDDAEITVEDGDDEEDDDEDDDAASDDAADDDADAMADDDGGNASDDAVGIDGNDSAGGNMSDGNDSAVSQMSTGNDC
ncbi:DUF4397 domain-containing protein [Natronoarchaeum rubrum]|uniref:DUF4397 domain-containing protein n=1 Tax=Natronoarchaeum rubrum TaxID=755311 RepID=UPI002113168A|nr:DUF4397 domain-containing protein [Natronoarchaeum rubrum]